MKRFKIYMQLYLTTNRRNLLLGVSLFMILPFLFILFMYYTDGERLYKYVVEDGIQPAYEYDAMWTYEPIAFMLFAFLIMAVTGSWTYRTMIGKKDRLQSIEIPASQLEKFLTWWIVCVPLSLMAMFVCFWIADLLRVIWIKSFTPYGSYAHLYPIKNLLAVLPPPDRQGYSSDIPMNSVGLIYSLLLFVNSIFALGGILFHKLNFLKTTGCIFVLGVIYSIVLGLGTGAFFDTNLGHLDERWGWEASEYFLFLSCVFALFTLGLYRLSYARMREEDIINRW